MAKQIIVLDVTKPNGTDVNVHCLFWLYPPVANQVPVPNAVSEWRAAQTADNTNLQTGAVIEESYSWQYPPGMTKAQIEADLLSKYNARVIQFNAQLNPNAYYGIFYDSGTGWSA